MTPGSNQSWGLLLGLWQTLALVLLRLLAREYYSSLDLWGASRGEYLTEIEISTGKNRMQC